MGRIGDGDVHAAYVEFRAKESDKVSLLFSQRPSCHHRSYHQYHQLQIETPSLHHLRVTTVFLLLPTTFTSIVAER